MIRFQSGSELKPFMRFQIARALAVHFLPVRHSESQNMKAFEKHLHEIEGNIFAAHLLAPADLIQSEARNLSPSVDLIAQLAEIFWVSRSFMSQRVLDLLAQKNS